ncbi:MAG: LON peptidase substrate-binding domain-containing protein [Betaproteobacteria bacterium]|nr:LON peptidase substrate-binding domain-containing protein [Betaproteobacteria bacterium]
MLLPIFPLGTVLFPGGGLSLKVFETRYLDMAKACLKNAQPFGICLIREGAEVGAPAIPEAVGTVARIDDWDMEQLGVLQLRVLGESRFRLLSSEAGPSGLIVGRVEMIEPDAPFDGEALAANVEFLKKVLPKVRAGQPPLEERYDDAAWVAFRVIELLPFANAIKQKMLELTDAGMRLEILQQFLREQRLID